MFLFYQCFSYRLSKNNFLNLKQWEIIKKIIISSDKNSIIREDVNKIIYNRYVDWSNYKALEFKKFHYYKCKHIPSIELCSYSNLGLLKAIKNYNGKNNFSNYANIYINGELLKGLTELYPITSISKYDRKKKQNISNKNIYSIKKKLNTKFIGYDDWLYEKLEIKNNYYNYKNIWEYNYENYVEFWEKINLLTPFEIYLIKSKYDYYFNTKESNINIAKKLGYSDEYIRYTIKKALKKIIYTIEDLK
jgi:DNA-directed RNA polymerase specialized sigma subunit